MKLLSVNCGLPREIAWHGTTVTTSIYKSPVRGRIVLRTLNLDGDKQSDLTVHGGKDKAVYCYPIVHYAYWRAELPDRALPMGAFGENFTVDGLPEDSTPGLPEDLTHVGDRFAVGSAEIVVTQPRLPCYKLGIRFDSNDMVRRFLKSGRSGFYAAVAREGEVGAGDEITVVSRDPSSIPVSEITRLYVAKSYSDEDTRQLRRLIALEALPDSWREYFREKLDGPDPRDSSEDDQTA